MSGDNMSGDNRILAVLLSMRRQGVPRRHLKRALRDNGMAATADALNELLDRLDSLSDVERAEVERLADRIAADESARRPDPADLEHDEWLIAENLAGDRQYVVHQGADADFIAEVFDSAIEAPAGYEAAPLDEGQVLSNVLWLGGEPPPPRERHRLYSRAREALRLYDARLGLDGGDGGPPG